MDRSKLLERITTNPEIFGGKLLFRDTVWQSSTFSKCSTQQTPRKTYLKAMIGLSQRT